jgi:hypothetical protein
MRHHDHAGITRFYRDFNGSLYNENGEGGTLMGKLKLHGVWCRFAESGMIASPCGGSTREDGSL